MATMAASVRGPMPSFTPTPTQNTAPVHEFRCLFTHDAHKKAKKWHDGFVRFHAFNRRVMVYDEGRNYIGDLHYRQDEDFDEGVELRLDRGILVDVGERLGESQTDLAPILDRKKDETSPRPARNLRLVPAASQKDPKSLSQILGTHPRPGRARALPSPYQQRQALAPVQPAEMLMPPPPKRQKVDLSGKENRPTSPRETKKPAQPVRQRTETTRPAPCSSPPKNPVVDFQEVVDLSSDEGISNTARKEIPQPKKRKTQSQARSKTLHQVRTKVVDLLTAGKSPTNRKRGIGKTTDLPEKPVNGTQGPGHKPRSHTENSSSRTKVSQLSTSSRSGMTQLKFRNQKPRRKLMYRALLTSSNVESAPSSGISPREERGDSPVVSLEPCETPSSPGCLPKPKSPDQKRGSLSWGGSTDARIHVPSSPLFIPEDNPSGSLSPNPRCSQDSLIAQMLEQPQTPQHEEKIQKQPDQLVTRMSPFTMPSTSLPNQPSLKTTRAPDLFPSNQKQMLPPPLLEPHGRRKAGSSSPRQKPFRRVRSEKDAVEEDILFDGLSAPPPSFLANPRASPVRASGSLSQSPAKLRRTASDSAMMEQENEKVASYNIQPIQEDMEDSGPWTSAEAYLLFEWWPPGKTKPDHGVPALKTGRCDPERVTITTARDMLRDEINVL